MPDISVIVCTHNPRVDFLELVLESLRAQTVSLDRWELLLIDNGSTEPLSKACDISWHPNGRHVREETLGLTHARTCGIRESRSELLVFVDDDNVLDKNYLQLALDLAAEWPKIGVFGGSQIASFEQPPHDEIKDHLVCLALRTIARVNWANIKGTWDATPYGAGLCIRRSPALAYAETVTKNRFSRMLDRSGHDGTFSGGDIDMAWSVCDCDYGMLVTPALVVTHLINKKRLNKAYILRISEGMSASEILLKSIHHLKQEKPSRIRRIRRRLYIQFNVKKGMERDIALADFRGKARGFRIIENPPEPGTRS